MRFSLPQTRVTVTLTVEGRAGRFGGATLSGCLAVIGARAVPSPVHGGAKLDQADSPTSPQPEGPRKFTTEREVVGEVP